MSVTTTSPPDAIQAMSHERQHSLVHSRAAAANDDHDLVPGQASRSAELFAPEQPMLSGLIQRKARDDNGVAVGAESAVASASASGGSALPANIMRKFESSLGSDLSDVRVHTGAESQTAAHAVGAKAYTQGQDIHFGAGHYDPGSSGGEHLLAHEVAHTVQQRGGASAGTQFKLEVSAPGDHHEHEADRAADAMIAGRPAAVSGTCGLARKIQRDPITTKPAPNAEPAETAEDHDLKKPPADPTFGGADGSFGAMASGLDASLKGGAGALAMPTTGIAGSQANLDATVRHAQSSETYYTSHSTYMNSALKVVAHRDAGWGISMLANLRIAGSATSSFVTLANSSNTAWSDLVAVAKGMSIEVTNNKDLSPLAKLDGQSHAPTVGDQKINASEVGGSGNLLAGDHKKSGIVESPDTSGYKQAMKEYTDERNRVTVAERNIIGVVNKVKVDAITKKQNASKEELEKWTGYAKVVDTMAVGVTAAVGGAAFVDGEVLAKTVGDPGAKTLTVGQQDGKQKLGVTDGEHSEGIVQSGKPPEVGAAAEKGKSALTFLINLKIEAITKVINNYTDQIQSYSDVAEGQRIKADIGAYNDALGRLRDKAKHAELERELMEKKLAEWAQKIDKALIAKGKAPKGSTESGQAANLLAKIRNASVETQAAIDALGAGGATDGSASVLKLYGDLARGAKEKIEAEVGRRDPRARVFAIEGGRWNAAGTSLAGVKAGLERRMKQIDDLEKEFLGTFTKNAGPTGAGSPGTKF